MPIGDGCKRIAHITSDSRTPWQSSFAACIAIAWWPRRRQLSASTQSRERHPNFGPPDCSGKRRYRAHVTVPNLNIVLPSGLDLDIMAHMGPRSSTPDLFSSANRPSMPPATTTSPPHVLPTDLTNAIKQLEDQELDRLLSAALAEQRRRGRKVFATDPYQRERKARPVPSALTRGRINAVRAAFKAGVTPSRIARQFGLSQSDVRKALASEDLKR